MINKAIILLAISMMYSLKLSAQENTKKCIEGVFYEEITKNEDKIILVYSGNDFSLAGLKDTILISGGKKWEKRKTDNCLSANPDDCLVWCFVDNYKEEKIKLVTDTKSIKEFTPRIIKEKIIVRKEEKKQEEIICPENLDKPLVLKIENFLFDNYYLKKKKGNGKMTSTIRNAVIKYQKANKLGIGDITNDTLLNMGIVK